MSDGKRIDEELTAQIVVLRRYAFALVRNEQDAEDLVQETLARAIDGAASWKRDRDLRRWLFGILHNVYVSSVRRYQVRARAAWFLESRTGGESAPDQYDRLELSDTATALLQLPEPQRQAILLVALEGMSYQEVAQTLNIPVGTLMSRLARGREALRAAVQRDGGRRLRLVE